MIDTFIVGAYWGPRAEPLPTVTEKTVATLKKIAYIDEQFANWYQLANSKKKALENKISCTNDNITSLYKKELTKTDVIENGFTQMSFSLSVWSGHENSEAGKISFWVGRDLKSIGNRCLINIPPEGEAQRRLLKIDKAKQLITVLVEEWNPDYAVLTSGTLRDRLGVLNEIGWVTYRKEINGKPDISDKVICEKLGNGYLFYLGLPDSNIYDYGLMDKLEPLKEII